jgi:protein involved in polysaccharide export with SLBB domain
MEIESPQSIAGESKQSGSSVGARQANRNSPMEKSVAMKRTVFLFAVLLAIPAFTAAQTQTRERRSNDSESPRTGSSTVRERVVGPRAANHAEKQKAIADAPLKAAASSESVRNPARPTIQNSAPPVWGNSSIVNSARPGERSAPLENTADKQRAIEPRDQPVKKLVQQTSLTPPPPKASPAAGNSSAVRSLAPTVVYHVGVGDVLDIRLTNLPTRESTLYTILKNGVLEYPLLSEPLSVGGMTTDEIANLLSNQIKVIKTARVSVSVRDYASHAVVITGLVDSPGKKTMRREAVPLFAVLAEALPRPEATFATIVRDDKSQSVSLSDVPSMSTMVFAGDVIRISGGDARAVRFVYVGGEVVSRGEKEFRDGMTLTQALLSAGGAVPGGPTRVRVARRDSNGFLKSSEYNLQLIEGGKSQDPLLEAGDRIEVMRGM